MPLLKMIGALWKLMIVDKEKKGNDARDRCFFLKLTQLDLATQSQTVTPHTRAELPLLWLLCVSAQAP